MESYSGNILADIQDQQRELQDALFNAMVFLGNCERCGNIVPQAELNKNADICSNCAKGV